jgi:hypothetical protein
LSAKWLELLKEIAPHVTRVAVIRDPTRGPGIGQFAVIQSAGQPLGVELRPVGTIRNPAIETLRDSFSLLGAIGVFDAAPRANYMKIDSRRATKMRHTISPSKI